MEGSSSSNNKKRCIEEALDGGEESNRPYTFLTIHCMKQEDGSKKIAWILNENDLKIGEGNLNDCCASDGEQEEDLELPTDFVNAMARIVTTEGFIVVCDFLSLAKTSPRFWTRLVESDEWPYMKKKCQILQMYIFVLVDKDCYQCWSLQQFHHEIFRTSNGNLSTDQNVAACAQMTSEIFYHLVSRNDEKRLVCGTVHDFGAAVSKIGFRQPVCRSNWVTQDELSRYDPSTFEDVKYVVVDVETHDWLDGQQPTRKSCIGRVVEIAWMVCDSDGNELDKRVSVLKPYGYESISDKARRFHRITTRCVKERGCDADLVFEKFVNLIHMVPNDGFVIAHNMRHEDAVFFNNLGKDSKDVWDQAPKCCTLSRRLLELLPDGRRYQRSKHGLTLSQLHKIVLPGREGDQLRRNAHSAFADVRMTWDVFHYYKQLADKRDPIMDLTFRP